MKTTKKLMLILLGVTSVLMLSSCNDTKNNEKDNLDTNEEELKGTLVDTIFIQGCHPSNCDYYIEIYNDDTSKLYIEHYVIFFDYNNYNKIDITFDYDSNVIFEQYIRAYKKEVDTFPGFNGMVTEDVYTFTYDTFEFILSEHRNLIKVNCNGFNTCKQYNFMI